MKKNFVLDTNVLLNDPYSIYAFEDNNVILPIYVLEEVDSFKKGLSELGKNARQVSRILDELRGNGRLVDGVPLGNTEGGTLRVAFADAELSQEFALFASSADSRILACAAKVQRDEPDVPCIFVTKDINLRVRGAALGLQVMDFLADKVHVDDLYSGVMRISVGEDVLSALFSAGTVPVAHLPEGARDVYANSFVVLQSDTGGSALARVEPEGKTLRQLKGNGPSVWGIRPRNKEQHFAFELLLDANVQLVTLVGQAGTGKTLLALAAGLQSTLNGQQYQRLLVSRPVFPLGKDIGFLPGDVNEKLRPWMQPVHDNLELLMGISGKERAARTKGRSSDEMFDMDMVHIEPLTYIRGRSIPNQYILVDEAQNLTPHEVKTIITRAGDNTKIVLTGDPYQIDNPYVDATSNGLVHVVNRFKGQGIYGHVTLSKGERSPLAERAAELL